MDNKENPTHILVVDDDDISREVLALLLEKEGYIVETVVSGDAALLHLQQTTGAPHVLLIDMQMPGISGAELAQQLRSLSHGKVMLLAMSASQPADSDLQGFNGFLLKPFTMQMLNAVIHGGPEVKEKNADLQSPVILNDAVYAKLAASMRPPQLEQLYTMCLSDAEKRIAAMRQAALNGDDASYRRDAHGIKGGSGLVGAVELQTLATSMEAHGLDDANHVATLDEFVAACGRLRRILVAHAGK